MTQAATVINKGRKDDEGFVPYRRWRGKGLARPVAEFGECVMYLPAASAGKNEFDARWWTVCGWGSSWRAESRP